MISRISFMARSSTTRSAVDHVPVAGVPATGRMPRPGWSAEVHAGRRCGSRQARGLWCSLAAGMVVGVSSATIVMCRGQGLNVTCGHANVATAASWINE